MKHECIAQRVLDIERGVEHRPALVGLWAGELQRPELALPVRHSDQDATRRVTYDQLARRLSALPNNRSTRISVARVVGEYVLPDVADEAATSFVEYRNEAELGGF